MACATATASAQEGPPPDGDAAVVYLRDGTVLHGRLMELVPSVGLELRDADGDVHVIPRESVMRVERQPPPTRAGATRAPAPSPAGGVSFGRVHISAGAGGAVLERANEAGAWVPVCLPPCNRLVPTTGTYRVGGAAMRPSTPFELAMKPGGEETLRVRGGSRQAFATGIVVLAVGPALASGAAFAAALDGGVNHRDNPSSADAAVIYGAVAVGAVSAVAGLVLLIVNASTGVEQVELTEPPSMPVTLDESKGQSAAPAALAGSTPALALPLLSGRF